MLYKQYQAASKEIEFLRKEINYYRRELGCVHRIVARNPDGTYDKRDA